MDFKHLIELADIKEQQALALTSYCSERMSYDDLQQTVDNYCKNMAITFLSSIDLNDDTCIYLKNYISNIGADKKHSGFRFYEALYTELKSLNSKRECQREI